MHVPLCVYVCVHTYCVCSSVRVVLSHGPPPMNVRHEPPGNGKTHVQLINGGDAMGKMGAYDPRATDVWAMGVILYLMVRASDTFAFAPSFVPLFSSEREEMCGALVACVQDTHTHMSYRCTCVYTQPPSSFDRVML